MTTNARELINQNKISWQKSFLDGFSQDENGEALPWMTYNAIEFLKNNLNKNHIVFEFGCGASTLFFAKRVKKVVSLETNKKWLEIVKEKLFKANLRNSEIHLMEDGLDNQNYEIFAKNYGEKFDFIIIDSIKRFQCCVNSISAIKPQGSVILDDSQRKNYQKNFDFFLKNNFTKQDFVGIAPADLKIKNTSIFTNA